LTSAAGLLAVVVGVATDVTLATGAGAALALSALLSVRVTAAAVGGWTAAAEAGGAAGATLLVSLTSLTAAADVA
jgi:hypothetical protein